MAFDDQILRGLGRVGFNKETAAFLQSAFRCPGEMPYIETRVWPDGSRGKGTSVRSPEQNHSASDAFEHVTLKRQPTLEEYLGGGGFSELSPEVIIWASLLAIPQFASFMT
jgi:hypothetical protein